MKNTLIRIPEAIYRAVKYSPKPARRNDAQATPVPAANLKDLGNRNGPVPSATSAAKPPRAPASPLNASPMYLRNARAGQSTANARINELIRKVRDQEMRLQAPSTITIHCTRLPDLAPHTGRIGMMPSNPMESMILLSQLRRDQVGKVCAVNPADPARPGRGFSIPGDFPYDGMSVEEAMITMEEGLLASLDSAVGAYPLGPGTEQQRQIYSHGLQFRHSEAVLQQLMKTEAKGAARFDAQRRILISAPLRGKDDSSFTFDAISIAAFHHGGAAELDEIQVCKAMYRQFANAFAAASREGVKTFVLTLPGGGACSMTSPDLDAVHDAGFMDVIAYAAMHAIRTHGAGMTFAIPRHGPRMDVLLKAYKDNPNLKPAALRTGNELGPKRDASHTPPKPQHAGTRMPASAAPPAPVRESMPKTVKAYLGAGVGAFAYAVHENAVPYVRSAPAPVFQKLKDVLREGEAIRLRRVITATLESIKRPYEVYQCHPGNPGRALIKVQAEDGKSVEVYEATFTPAEQPALTRLVADFKGP